MINSSDLSAESLAILFTKEVLTSLICALIKTYGMLIALSLFSKWSSRSKTNSEQKRSKIILMRPWFPPIPAVFNLVPRPLSCHARNQDGVLVVIFWFLLFLGEKCARRSLHWIRYRDWNRCRNSCVKESVPFANTRSKTCDSLCGADQRDQRTSWRYGEARSLLHWDYNNTNSSAERPVICSTKWRRGDRRRWVLWDVWRIWTFIKVCFKFNHFNPIKICFCFDFSSIPVDRLVSFDQWPDSKFLAILPCAFPPEKITHLFYSFRLFFLKYLI